jgi:hypothetical protein
MHFLPHPVKYKDYTCRIGISFYDSDPSKTAIVANDWDIHSPITVFTKNIVTDNTQKDEVVIDINNCGEEAVKALKDAQIIGEKVRTVVSGFCNYPVYKLLVNT